MTTIYCTVETKWMNELKRDIGAGTDVEVLQDALTMFRWAIDQAKLGRLVTSCNASGGDVSTLNLRSIRYARSGS
jgi:hypothetical protein